ncbi:unnamed protein product [Prorocentrum cordatum]|uniref:Uncharacterized protein n=1 Tax=Prorocentrum cordatum TaxID=2364126 RepID=A0ABN9UHI1_9DINO|nr:unnamed protein product [Polarella glacialis]
MAVTVLLAAPAAGAGQGLRGRARRQPECARWGRRARGRPSCTRSSRGCICKTNKGCLEKSIADADARIEQLTADIEDLRKEAKAPSSQHAARKGAHALHAALVR